MLETFFYETKQKREDVMLQSCPSLFYKKIKWLCGNQKPLDPQVLASSDPHCFFSSNPYLNDLIDKNESELESLFGFQRQRILQEYFYEGTAYSYENRAELPFLLKTFLEFLDKNELENIRKLKFFVYRFQSFCQKDLFQNKILMEKMDLIREVMDFFYSDENGGSIKELDSKLIKCLLEKIILQEEYVTKIESQWDKIWGFAAWLPILLANALSDTGSIIVPPHVHGAATNIFGQELLIGHQFAQPRPTIMYCISLIFAGTAWAQGRYKNQTHAYPFFVYKEALKKAIELIQKREQENKDKWFCDYFSKDVIEKINHILPTSKILFCKNTENYPNQTSSLKVESVDWAVQFKEYLRNGENHKAQLLANVTDFINQIMCQNDNVSQNIHKVVFVHNHFRGTLFQHLSLVLDSDQMKGLYEKAPLTFLKDPHLQNIQTQSFLEIKRNRPIQKKLASICWQNRNEAMRESHFISLAIHTNAYLSQAQKEQLFQELEAIFHTKENFSEVKGLHEKRDTRLTDTMVGCLYLGFALTKLVGLWIPLIDHTLLNALLSTIGWITVASMPVAAFYAQRCGITRSLASARQFMKKNKYLCTPGADSLQQNVQQEDGTKLACHIEKL